MPSKDFSISQCCSSDFQPLGVARCLRSERVYILWRPMSICCVLGMDTGWTGRQAPRDDAPRARLGNAICRDELSTVCSRALRSFDGSQDEPRARQRKQQCRLPPCFSTSDLALCASQTKVQGRIVVVAIADERSQVLASPTVAAEVAEACSTSGVHQ